MSFPEKQDQEEQSKFLKYLDDNLEYLGIDSYSIKQTSLEQVFLQVAAQHYR